jgi:hypothetical protein
MPYGPTNFRSTIVKPYFRDLDGPEYRPVYGPENRPQEDDDLEEDDDPEEQRDEEYRPENDPQPLVKRGRGRPKGSKNKIQTAQNVTDEPDVPVAFITRKEQSDKELAVQLRKDGVITTPGEPFESS